MNRLHFLFLRYAFISNKRSKKVIKKNIENLYESSNFYAICRIINIAWVVDRELFKVFFLRLIGPADKLII